MALLGINLNEWILLENKTERTPVPFTGRILEVGVKILQKKNDKLILVSRKIVETGVNRQGQHIQIHSTTIHKIDDFSHGDRVLVANFMDNIKLNRRGKTIQVRKL